MAEERKLSADEIIAALECCHTDEDMHLCAQCPLVDIPFHQCRDLLGRNALILIYRLRMEVGGQ